MNAGSRGAPSSWRRRAKSKRTSLYVLARSSEPHTRRSCSLTCASSSGPSTPSRLSSSHSRARRLTARPPTHRTSGHFRRRNTVRSGRLSPAQGRARRRLASPTRRVMRRVSPYLKMRVLGAIEYAPGMSIVARIRHVAQQPFTDENGVRFQVTWRTIQTWTTAIRRTAGASNATTWPDLPSTSEPARSSCAVRSRSRERRSGAAPGGHRRRSHAS